MVKDAPDFQKTVVLNSTPSFTMPTADSPDWQETVQLVNSPHSDAPDWQQYIVGPGGVPITPSPTRLTVSRIADWSDSGSSVVTLAVSPVNVGDLLVFSAAVYGSQTITAGPTGGGVTTWVPVTSGKSFDTQETVYQWQGVVTATGASNITITTSAPANTMLMATELNTPIAAPQWYVYGSTFSGESSQTTYRWLAPILTPQGASEMYLAFIATGNGGLSMPFFVSTYGGTTVFNGGSFAGYAVVASLPGVAYPTNYANFLCNANTTIYDQIGCLIYATD
jgi:hypothetical protein